MRLSVIILLLTFSCLFAFGAEKKAEAISFYPSLDNTTFLEKYPQVKQEGIFFSTLITPPHKAMVKGALASGKNALLQGIYGEFHIESPSRQREKDKNNPPYNQVEEEAPTPEFPTLPVAPALIVGKNFAWLRDTEAPAREESRPVTPEDLGATFLLLRKKSPLPPLSGRDVRVTDPWSVLVTHAGEWEPNIHPERMHHRGLIVLSPKGLLKNDLLWNDRELDQLSPEELKETYSLSQLSTLWWKQAVEILNNPPPLSFSAPPEICLRLTPNQWRSSFIEPGLPYMPEKGYPWTHETIATAIRHLKAPGLGGRWYLYFPKEGNYEVTFSLNSPESSEEKKILFKKGDALIRVGGTLLRMNVLDGAEEIRVALDITEGAQSFEINITGQGEPNASLSVPYASLRYKGERITPVIDFNNKAKP